MLHGPQISPARIHRIRNTRKRPPDPKKLAELRESVRTFGIFEPLVVRPREDGDVDLVCGERRLTVAEELHLEEVPIVVRVLDDAQMIEAQLIENGQREDVHPLDEADAFAELHRAHGRSVQQLALETGHPERFIYQRIKLAGLVEPARAAFFAGQLTVSTALLLVGLPSASLQEKALGDLVADGEDGPMTYEEARRVLRSKYMLYLADAPFDRGDAALLARAGACTNCPKRTAAQAELFADEAADDDYCLDAGCWHDKVGASWQRRAAAARAAGVQVFEREAAREVFAHQDAVRPDAPYVNPEEPVWRDREQRTLAEIAAAAGKALPVVALAQDEDGVAHELVDKKAAEKLLRSQGIGPVPGANGAPAKDEKDWELEREVRRRTWLATLGALAAAVMDLPLTEGLLRLLVKLVLGLAVDEIVEPDMVCERRGWEVPPASRDEASFDPAAAVVLAKSKAMPKRELAGLLAELLATAVRPGVAAIGDGGALEQVLAELGIDERKLEARARAAVERERARKEEKNGHAAGSTGKKGSPAKNDNAGGEAKSSRPGESAIGKSTGRRASR